MKKASVISVLVLVSALGLGCDGNISEEQYDSIRMGMTKSSVLDELGSPMGGAVGGIWQYGVKKDGYSDLVSIQFDDSGKVISINRQ